MRMKKMIVSKNFVLLMIDVIQIVWEIVEMIFSLIEVIFVQLIVLEVMIPFVILIVTKMLVTNSSSNFVQISFSVGVQSYQI